MRKSFFYIFTVFFVCISFVFSQCSSSSGKIKSVRILQEKSSLILKIKLHPPLFFEKRNITHDSIDLEVSFAKKQQSLSRIILDPASRTMLSLMGNLADSPKELTLQSYLRKQREERYLYWREHPESFSRDYKETNPSLWKSEWANSAEEAPTRLFPEAKILLFSKNTKDSLEPLDSTHFLLKTSENIIKTPFFLEDGELKISLPLKDYSEISLAIFDTDGIILDVFGDSKTTNFRGAYMLVEDLEILPKCPLKTKLNHYRK